jgi:hypothetical protein
MRNEDQASAILAFEQGKNVGKIGVMDCPDDDRGMNESVREQFTRLGVHSVAPAKGPGSRIAKWNLLRQALHYEKDAEGNITRFPKLRVFSTCTNGIRTLPAMVHDKLKPEDLDTDAEDHWCDALACFFQQPAVGNETPPDAMSDDDAAFWEQARKERHVS